MRRQPWICTLFVVRTFLRIKIEARTLDRVDFWIFSIWMMKWAHHYAGVSTQVFFSLDFCFDHLSDGSVSLIKSRFFSLLPISFLLFAHFVSKICFSKFFEIADGDFFFLFHCGIPVRVCKTLVLHQSTLTSFGWILCRFCG